MTVFPRWRNLEPSSRATRSPSLEREPDLAELLHDPVLHALMARDGVDRATLEGVIADARQKLGLAERLPREGALRGECRR